MNSNLLKVLLLFSVAALIMVVIMYTNNINEKNRLKDMLIEERNKEVISDKTEQFIEDLYKGNGSTYLSENAIKRYSNYTVNDTGEKPVNTEKNINIYLTNTSLENYKYQSSTIYDLNETIDGNPYSTTTLKVTIDWVYEDEIYKVDYYSFELINSVLTEFAQ